MLGRLIKEIFIKKKYNRVSDGGNKMRISIDIEDNVYSKISEYAKEAEIIVEEMIVFFVKSWLDRYREDEEMLETLAERYNDILTNLMDEL